MSLWLVRLCETHRRRTFCSRLGIFLKESTQLLLLEWNAVTSMSWQNDFKIKEQKQFIFTYQDINSFSVVMLAHQRRSVEVDVDLAQPRRDHRHVDRGRVARRDPHEELVLAEGSTRVVWAYLGEWTASYLWMTILYVSNKLTIKPKGIRFDLRQLLLQ